MNTSLTAESMDGYTITALKQLSTTYDTVFVGSLAIEDLGKYYNRAVLIEDGEVKTFYDKNYLFSPSKENEVFTAGKMGKRYNWNGINIFLQICYDLRFPELVRPHNSIDLIINVANWPQQRIHHWNKLLQARAIENQCFVIGCNRSGTDENGWVFSGSSQVVDPHGDILLNLGQDEKFLVTTIDITDAHTLKEKLPFQNDKK